MDPWPCASAQNPGKMGAGKLGGLCQPLTKTFQCSFTQKVSHHLTLTQDARGSKTHHDVIHVALRTLIQPHAMGSPGLLYYLTSNHLF